MRAARGRQVFRATEAHAGRDLSPRGRMHRPDWALLRALRVGKPHSEFLRRVHAYPKEPSGRVRVERPADGHSSRSDRTAPYRKTDAVSNSGLGRDLRDDVDS